MSQMLNFRLVKVLSSVFTPDLAVTKAVKFLEVVNELLGDRLDGEPTILPIPQDAPGDIPRIQLASADKMWAMEISLHRTNLHYQPPFSAGESMDSGEFGLIASEFFSNYQRMLDLRVQRLGFVTERVCPEENAAGIIADRFCRKEYLGAGAPFVRLRGFEVHSLKGYDWKNFTLNSWVRFKSGIHKKHGPFVSLQNDLNTTPYQEDPDREFTPEDVIRFFERIPHHLNEILGLYSSMEDKIGDGKRWLH